MAVAELYRNPKQRQANWQAEQGEVKAKQLRRRELVRGGKAGHTGPARGMSNERSWRVGLARSYVEGMESGRWALVTADRSQGRDCTVARVARAK